MDSIVSNKFDENNFLLDYIEFRKGNINISDYAKKYSISIWEILEKFSEYKLEPTNRRP